METFPKFEDKAGEKWNETFKAIQEAESKEVHALKQKDDSQLIAPELILVD